MRRRMTGVIAWWWLDETSETSDDMNEKELRYWPVEFQLRAEEGASPVIRGYAVVFNQLSEDLGGFREKVAPGAFARSLAQNDIRALWDHDPKYVLGRNTVDTLSLGENDHGLWVEIEPPATSWARDLLKSMDRGDVSQMSFGFVTRSDHWEDGAEGPIRTLMDVDLFDVSVVTYPAYPQTSAEARDKATALRQAARPGDDGGEAARTQARRAAMSREIMKLNLEK